VDVLRDVVVFGQFQVEYIKSHLNCGVLVEMDTDFVLGTVANTILEQVVELMQLKQSQYAQGGPTQFVQVELMDVATMSVLDVVDAVLM
jgi:hypothetical protein